MNTLQPTFSLNQVRSLLRDVFQTEPLNLTEIDENQLTQSFSFSVLDKCYVVRFSAENLDHRFRQEKHLSQRYASDRLPIPSVHHTGTLEGFFYGIGAQTTGKPLEAHAELDVRNAIKNIIALHDAIRTADVSRSTGFGWMLKDNWNGFHDSWHTHIKYVAEEEPEGMFYQRWHHLFDDSFLERDVFEAMYQRMLDLLPFCPEERYLSHGGFGFQKIIGHQDGTITAIEDWLDARFGDFVLDVAYADYWWDYDVADHFLAHWKATGFTVPYANERLLCYQLYTYLDGMRFFAKIGDKQGYDHIARRIERAQNGFDRRQQM